MAAWKEKNVKPEITEITKSVMAQKFTFPEYRSLLLGTKNSNLKETWGVYTTIKNNQGISKLLIEIRNQIYVDQSGK